MNMTERKEITQSLIESVQDVTEAASLFVLVVEYDNTDTAVYGPYKTPQLANKAEKDFLNSEHMDHHVRQVNATTVRPLKG
jgi:hypothetical protein